MKNPVNNCGIAIYFWLTQAKNTPIEKIYTGNKKTMWWSMSYLRRLQRTYRKTFFVPARKLRNNGCYSKIFWRDFQRTRAAKDLAPPDLLSYTFHVLVLGIDPGIERTGFAVLASERGKIRVLDFGCIMTDKKHPFSNRLVSLATDLRSILRQWKPSACAVEQLFFSKNVKTAMKVSHARGVILEVLEEHGVPVQELNPGHIKLAICGSARADKLQLRKMLHLNLGLDVRQDDTADAIAAALCMLTTKNYEKNVTPFDRRKAI